MKLYQPHQQEDIYYRIENGLLTPEDEEQRNSVCRACSNGWGDGCCSYHANKFRVLEKQITIQNKHAEE